MPAKSLLDRCGPPAGNISQLSPWRLERVHVSMSAKGLRGQFGLPPGQIEQPRLTRLERVHAS